jgi:hypothetical protein
VSDDERQVIALEAEVARLQREVRGLERERARVLLEWLQLSSTWTSPPTAML